MSSPDARISISPHDALVDHPLEIRLEGFEPWKPIDVEAVASFPGSWSVAATFTPDARGVVDLDTQAPESGDYAVADANALIWSLSPREPGTNPRTQHDHLAPWTLTVTAGQGEATVTETIVRRPIAEDVKLIEVREDGLFANLFLPDGNGPFPTVLVLGGSGGGYSDGQAALLASHGFAAVSLAYFGIEGLPEELRRIPLEYFARALDWIADHPLLESRRLAVSGTSRGGELALLLATRHPEIRSVVAWVPSGYVWGAVSRIEDRGNEDDFASWTLDGRSVPYAGRVRNDDVAPDAEGVIHLTPAFLRYIADTERAERALIPVENINGPILLVSGQADALWPSAHFSDLIVERLEARGFDFPVEHLSYPDSGHGIGGGYAPTTINQGFHPVRKAQISHGGTVAGRAVARAESWPRALEFLRQHTSPVHFVGDDVAAVTRA
jgi:dienelactone hydrolase